MPSVGDDDKMAARIASLKCPVRRGDFEHQVRLASIQSL
jgi:hypothetical protein